MKRRCPRIESLPLFINRIGVEAWVIVTLKSPTSWVPPLFPGSIDRPSFGIEIEIRFKVNDDLGLNCLLQRQKIAHVIAVRMGEKDGVQRGSFLRFPGISGSC